MTFRRGEVGRTVALATGMLAVSLLVGYAPATTGPAGEARVPPPIADTSLVFDGVVVIDVAQGKLVPDQRVVISGNRITAIGNTTAFKLPKDARVVDARGKYLIPGLWDMHTHATHGKRMDQPFFSLFIANGVTGIRDASSDLSLDTLRQIRQEVLGGIRVGPPRQILSGPMIQTYCRGLNKNVCAALGRPSDSAQLVERVRQVVDSLKSAGADMIKIRDVYPATTFVVVTTEARRIGLKVGGHAWDSVDVAVSNAGASLIDHVEPWYPVPEGLRSWCWTPKSTADPAQCQAVAERFRQNNTWVVPTLAVYVGMRGRSRLTRRTYALVERLKARTTGFLNGSPLEESWLQTPPLDSASVAASPVLPDSLGVLRLMERAGVPIVAGTDAAPGLLQRVFPGFSLHAELAVSVAEGLTPLGALQSATLNPAKMLQGTDSLGTVATGKLADLVLLDANPLDDITNITRIRAVVANGRYFDRAALDSLLKDAQANWPR